MMHQTLYEGVRLASWGIGLLLGWTVLHRTLTAFFSELHLLGYPVKETTPWPPIRSAAPLTVLFAAAATAMIPLVAFTAPITAGVVRWFTPYPWPGTSIMALHLLLVVEMYFLLRITDRPIFNSAWAVCWYIFAMGVVFL